MKNVIILICDSLTYDDDMLIDMPLLSQFKENLIVFTNYFSQAPFTDAAIAPIMTGSNVLDGKGYIHNIKHHKYNINEIFKKMGYFTYNTLWSYPNTLSFLRGLDEYDYMDGALIAPFYRYRVKYFQEIFEKGQFTSKQYKIFQELLSDFFGMSEIFVNDYVEKPYKFKLIKQHTEFKNFNFKRFAVEESENRNAFLKNPSNYIYNLLNRKNNFFAAKEFYIFHSKVFEEYLPIIKRSTKKIMFKQFYYSLKNFKTNNSLKTFKNMLKNYRKDRPVNNIRSWILNILKYRGKYTTHFLSSNIVINNTIEHLDANKDKRNFIINHINDNHSPLNFFTRESMNIEKEYENFINSTKKITENRNIFYKLSRNYVDMQINNLICSLKEMELLEDTIIVITSDHGSSYVGKIFRDEITHSFYDENYKIPLIILDKTKKGFSNNNLSISTQFIPTLLDYLKVENYSEWVKEESILRNTKHEIIFEYFGAGCPDYTSRDKLFSIRNNKFKILCNNVEKYNFSGIVITAVYDLITDPLEKKNIKKLVQHNPEVKFLVKKLEERVTKLL